MRLPRSLFALVLAGFAAAAPAAASEHVGFWFGYGVGFFAEGGPGASDADSHKFGGLSYTLPGESFRVCWMRGSLERTDLPIPGDNDADYHLFDLILTRRLTHLPFDVAFGPARCEQHFPAGYPHAIGERILEKRWGEHLSVVRDFELGHRLALWTELGLVHVSFPEARETIATLDVGLRLHI